MKNIIQVIRTSDSYPQRKQEIRVEQTAGLMEELLSINNKEMSKPHFNLIVCDLSCKTSMSEAVACSDVESLWKRYREIQPKS